VGASDEGVVVVVVAVAAAGVVVVAAASTWADAPAVDREPPACPLEPGVAAKAAPAESAADSPRAAPAVIHRVVFAILIKLVLPLGCLRQGST
jgi:hypothetical protein